MGEIKIAVRSVEFRFNLDAEKDYSKLYEESAEESELI